MQITLTPGEAQAIADLIDRETRMNGAQAAAIYGGVMRQIIEAAQAEQQKEETNGDDHTES